MLFSSEQSYSTFWKDRNSSHASSAGIFKFILVFASTRITKIACLLLFFNLRASTKLLDLSIFTPFMHFSLKKLQGMRDFLNPWHHTKKNFLMKLIPHGVNLTFWSNYTSKHQICSQNKKGINLIATIMISHESLQVKASREDSPSMQEGVQAQRSHFTSSNSWYQSFMVLPGTITVLMIRNKYRMSIFQILDVLRAHKLISSPPWWLVNL